MPKGEKMKLDWDNFGDIAVALEDQYAGEDLVNINEKKLLKLILSLPEFSGSAEPKDEHVLDDVLSAWNRLADNY